MYHLNKILNGLKIQLEHPVVDVTDYPNEEKDQIVLGLAYKFKTTYIGRWVENRLLALSEKDEQYFAIYRSYIEVVFYPDGTIHLVHNRMLDEKFIKELRKELEDEDTDESNVLIYACDVNAGYNTVDLIPLKELITDLKDEAKRWYKEMMIHKKQEEIRAKEKEIEKLKEEIEKLKGELCHD